MRKLFVILAAVLLTASVFAQTPEKMSYQAVVRNSENNLMQNTQVGMQISILQGSADGTAVYVETQTPTTNANGLVNTEIGVGTVVSGNFTTIDWANGAYFIKTETDPTGGTSYTITGVSQLLSVPYALYAKTSDYNNLANKPTIDGSETKLTAGDNISIIGSGTSASPYVVNQKAGTKAGQMQYWNGTAWVTVAATQNEGATLQMIGGVPTWTGGTPPPTPNVTNPATGEVWMDRNLGASRVATSSTDADAYGDLYQWGRAADGHESRTSGITSTLATSDTPGHSDFIAVDNGPYSSWLSPLNDNLWQGVSGINNPCPSGYRLPTNAEWQAELDSWSSYNPTGAFASPLKLPAAGYRRYSSGSLTSEGSVGYYWSSTVSNSEARLLSFFSGNAYTYTFGRAYGLSVRCIKD